MPVPTPTPEPEEIEAVREIAQLYSYASAETFINRLENVQWTATLADIAAWNAVKNKHTRIEGDGVKIDKDRNRLDISNRVRIRLGLPAVESLNDTGSGCGDYVTYTAPRKDDCLC